MNIFLPPEWQQFVQHELATGHYASPTEVIYAGLRRLAEDRALVFPAFPASLDALDAEVLNRLDRAEAEGKLMVKPLHRHRSVAELEERLLQGVERLDRGEGIDGKEARRQFEEHTRNRSADA